MNLAGSEPVWGRNRLNIMTGGAKQFHRDYIERLFSPFAGMDERSFFMPKSKIGGNVMNYQEFIESVKQDLSGKLTGSLENAIVDSIDVNKLQGQSYSGVSIRPENSEIAISVDLEQYFTRYENGVPYDSVLQQIADFAISHQLKAPIFDMDKLNDYEAMKPFLDVQVVSRDANAEKLAAIPHQLMEDMAVVYRFNLEETESGRASILLTNQMLNTYGIDQEQLHQDAVQNAEIRNPVSIRNMNEILFEMSGGLFGSPDDLPSPMYVATNDIAYNGAGVMTYSNFMEQAAEKLNGSFYVLPSSIHEVILVPDAFGMKAPELKAMVTEVNGTQVSPKERLTDNVYHFDAQARVFEQAEKFEKRVEKEQARKSVLHDLGNKKKECLSQESKNYKAPKREEMAL